MPGGTGTNDQHVLLLSGRLETRLIVLDVRIHRAGDGLAEHDTVQAAQAADAGADLLGAARSGLVAELGVAQVGAAHHADVGGAVLDELLGDPGLVDTAHGGHGNGHVLLDLARKGGMAGPLGACGGNRGAALDGGAAGDVEHGRRRPFPGDGTRRSCR